MKLVLLIKILIQMDLLKILQVSLIKKKNILGMMPHPERMIDPFHSGEDGSLFFKNLINNLR